MPKKSVQSDEEWQNALTPEQFAVLRQKDTEPPFSGAYVHNDQKGDYRCAACGALLFTSETKFDSGSGWPSFYDQAVRDAVELVPDSSHGMERTEVRCATCGGHLGHLFADAYNQPTGMRYCVNSVALEFRPRSKE